MSNEDRIVEKTITSNEHNIISTEITELQKKINSMSSDEIDQALDGIKQSIAHYLPHEISTILTNTDSYKKYRTLGQLILRVLNEPIDLYDSMRRILSLIKSAVGVDAVGIRLEKDSDYPYFTSDGFSEDFLSKENSLLAHDRDGGICRDSEGNVSLECTCGLILTGEIDPENPLFTPGGSSWTNNSFPFLDVPIEDDPRYHPRNTCIHQGYASVALIPIRAKGKNVGLIHLNDHQTDCFTIDIIEALEAIGENIGEALLRKQAEHQVNERVKELQAFYNLVELTEIEGISLIPFYESFIQKLPDSWQYPDITGARIIINDYCYQTPNFKETKWLLSAPIRILNSICGSIDICYLESRPTADEGPFLHEEKMLISAVADRVGTITARKQTENTLRESEERYRAVFNNNHAVMLLINPDTGEIKDANLAACNFYGYSYGELTSKNINKINIMSQDDIRIAIEDTMTVKRNHFLFKHRLSNGEIRDVEVYSGPIQFGKSKMLYSFIHDISERKRAEENLQRSEVRHRTILQSAMDGFCVIDSNSYIKEVNEAFCRMSGYTEYELLKMQGPEIEFIDNMEEFYSHMKEIEEHGEARFESKLRCKNENIINVEVSVQHRKDDDVKIAFIRDITTRKQIEEVQLFLAKMSSGDEKEPFFNELSRFLAEKISMDFICIDRLDSDGLTAHTLAVWHDGTFEDNISYTLKDTPCAEVVDKSICYFPAKVAQLFPNDEVLQDLKAESYAGITLIGHTGQPVGLIAVISRKPMKNPSLVQSMLKLVAERSVGELERLNAAEEKAKLEIQLQQNQKLESIGRLAGGVAHDFNNMLCVIMGHAEMALDKINPNDSVYNDLKEIATAAQRSAELTRQLLAFARKQTIAPKQLDLNQTISGMLKMLKRLIGEEIDLNWQSEAELWSILMDTSQIDQILANLCVNARDAITGVGAIIIEAANCKFSEKYCANNNGYLQGEFVRLSVKDSGCGMNLETMEHIFEPFFTTKAINEGTGLGLSTVYGAVKQNNGFIIVNSEEGHGTTFNIYLPRYIGENESKKENDQLSPVKCGKETVLVVEDEKIILKLTTAMLNKLGYNTLSANTPAEAISKVKSYNDDIHLIITDVIMPEMNGRDLSKLIIDLHPETKCMFISGYTADVIAHHGVLEEGVKFLQKPFSIKDLASLVRDVIDE